MSFIVIPVFVLSLVIAAVRLSRPRSSHCKMRSKSRFGFYPSAAGTALQTIQAIVHPRAQNVIATVCDEHLDEDDSGEPNDPVQHLHHQAAKIRRGEPIDHITALLPSPPPVPGSPA